MKRKNMSVFRVTTASNKRSIIIISLDTFTSILNTFIGPQHTIIVFKHNCHFKTNVFLMSTTLKYWCLPNTLLLFDCIIWLKTKLFFTWLYCTKQKINFSLYKPTKQRCWFLQFFISLSRIFVQGISHFAHFLSEDHLFVAVYKNSFMLNFAGKCKVKKFYYENTMHMPVQQIILAKWLQNFC